MRRNTFAEVMSRVDKRGPDECWPWMGSGVYGYGVAQWNGERWRIHRLALYMATGIHPLDKLALHSCDNRACCNPAHLRWGTYAENAADKSRRNKAWVSRSSALCKARRKLLPSQADYIRRLLAAGYTGQQCADWYEVTPSIVSRIKLGQSYVEGQGL